MKLDRRAQLQVENLKAIADLNRVPLGTLLYTVGIGQGLWMGWRFASQGFYNAAIRALERAHKDSADKDHA